MVVVVLTKFVATLDPAVRELILTRDLSQYVVVPMSPIEIFGSILVLAAVILIVVKLVPLIKMVHEVGRLRALLIIAVAGVVDELYGWFVCMPFVAEMVKSTTKA